jgi:hypothetical protein
MKKIVKSAIKYKDRIYAGVRHNLIAEEIRKKDKNYKTRLEEQGFLTSSGQFVNREKAAQIAYKAGQIPNGIYSLDSYQIFKLK